MDARKLVGPRTSLGECSGVGPKAMAYFRQLAVPGEPTLENVVRRLRDGSATQRDGSVAWTSPPWRVRKVLSSMMHWMSIYEVLGAAALRAAKMY